METPPPSAQPPEGPHPGAVALSPEKIAAARDSAPFSPPSASELLHALGKTLQPRWRQLYRPPVRPATANRAQAAVAIGTFHTEAILAAQARDTQQVRNVLQDLEALQKMLGVTDQLRPRLQRMEALAEGENWESLIRETSAARSELAAVLEMLRDADLARLVQLGAWLRALHIDVAARLEEEGEPRDLPFALQGDFLEWTQEQIQTLSSSIQGERIVSQVQGAVGRLREIRGRPAPLSQQTAQVAAVLSGLMSQINVA